MAGAARIIEHQVGGTDGASVEKACDFLHLEDRGGFRWQIKPSLADLFLGPLGIRLPDWLRAGQARIVKQGPHRSVYRVQLPELCFYLKHNRLPDWPSWLRQLVRPSKARMEFDRARGVAARGIATFEPLALGEERAFLGAGESFLVTRTLEDAEPLHRFVAGALPALAPARCIRIRHQLTRELALLAARLHDSGICHNDLHAGNLLVRLWEDDRLQLFLIDLNAVHLGAPLSWPKSLENLVMLNRWFVPRSSRADRLRFWQTYRQARAAGKGCEFLHSRAGFVEADELERRTRASSLEFWKHRDRRCLKDNRYYRRVRVDGVAGYAVTDLDQDVLEKFTADPDAPFHWPEARVLKDSRSCTVVEFELLVAGQARRVIYKRFKMTSWTDPWTALVRQTPALRSWIQGQGFRERGLPTARPLAVFERTRLGLRRQGYLLAEKIANAQDLHEFLADMQRLSRPERSRLVRRQIEQVAQVVREMHNRCLSHRDLKASNLLVSRDYSRFLSPFSSNPWGGEQNSLLPVFPTTIWLIDLVGVRRHRRLARSRKAQNLARLNASFLQSAQITRTDRLRFLRTYLDWGLYGAGDWKTWWKAVERATQEKVRKNQRSGRPLK
ncbi:MAG: phosphotransferase [Gemmataceae bacterium]|nr:phosphotransferase [Gemmataceae bacterium]MCI0742849.1 phosphotransferase [Gemmataceae bacterium]